MSNEPRLAAHIRDDLSVVYADASHDRNMQNPVLKRASELNEVDVEK